MHLNQTVWIYCTLNPIALRTAKTLRSFDCSECNNINCNFLQFIVNESKNMMFCQFSLIVEPHMFNALYGCGDLLLMFYCVKYIVQQVKCIITSHIMLTLIKPTTYPNHYAATFTPISSVIKLYSIPDKYPYARKKSVLPYV